MDGTSNRWMNSFFAASFRRFGSHFFATLVRFIASSIHWIIQSKQAGAPGRPWTVCLALISQLCHKRRILGIGPQNESPLFSRLVGANSPFEQLFGVGWWSL